MEKENIEIIGFIAAFLTTISFLPQSLKTIRTKNTEALSLSMYSLFVIGVLMWFIYGIYKNSYPIIIANAITLILSGIILTYIVKFRFKK